LDGTNIRSARPKAIRTHYCVRVHVGQKSHLLRDWLRSLATRLDPNRFGRTHRSAIVNVTRVRELQ